MVGLLAPGSSSRCAFPAPSGQWHRAAFVPGHSDGLAPDPHRTSRSPDPRDCPAEAGHHPLRLVTALVPQDAIRVKRPPAELLVMPRRCLVSPRSRLRREGQRIRDPPVRKQHHRLTLDAGSIPASAIHEHLGKSDASTWTRSHKVDVRWPVAQTPPGKRCLGGTRAPPGGATGSRNPPLTSPERVSGRRRGSCHRLSIWLLVLLTSCLPSNR
jgi:hypothetical protein